MLTKRLITIATLVAVLALTLGVPVFASGCGDDDDARWGRTAQQSEDRDGGDGNYGGRGMMDRQNQSRDFDRYGICDQGADCLGYGYGKAECDGDCDGPYYENCPGATNGECDGDCLGGRGPQEPLCF